MSECDRCERESDTIGEGGLCVVCRDALADADADVTGGDD